MGQTHASITAELKEFIAAQHVFFVATAPLSGDGHINLSPKGMNTFRVLSDCEVGYADLTGSGNETSAHVLENGRITFMFCAFEGPPRILRLYGQGRVVLPDAPEWPALSANFETLPGFRQIITATIDRVQTSCGFGVPFMKFSGERDTLVQWAEKKKADGLTAYQMQKNVNSIDGLPTHLKQYYERKQNGRD